MRTLATLLHNMHATSVLKNGCIKSLFMHKVMYSPSSKQVLWLNPTLSKGSWLGDLEDRGTVSGAESETGQYTRLRLTFCFGVWRLWDFLTLTQRWQEFRCCSHGQALMRGHRSHWLSASPSCNLSLRHRYWIPHQTQQHTVIAHQQQTFKVKFSTEFQQKRKWKRRNKGLCPLIYDSPRQKKTHLDNKCNLKMYLQKYSI